MTRSHQPRDGEKVRISQWWPKPLRARILRQAAKEKRTVSSMTVVLVERALEKSEAKS